MYAKYLKRAIDLSLVLVLTPLLAPIFALAAILIKLDSKGPVLFRQTRAGKELRPFTVYKFRTMYTDTPKYSPTRNLLDSKSHITKVGKYMRLLSIDELPQFINVLKGDMSMVGPRPVVVNETDLLEAREKYGANAIKPGITGWAQINGRDELDVISKAEMDGHYTDKLGIKIDMACLIMTVLVVLLVRGHREGSGSEVTQKTPWPNSLAPGPAFYSKVTPYRVNRSVNNRIRRKTSANTDGEDYL